MKHYDNLNPRQKVFVDEYIKTGNASKAAKKAGYKGEPKVTGSKMLTKVNLKAAIKEREKTSREKRILSGDEVLQELTDLALNADKEETRLQALIALGKRWRLFTDKIEHDIGENTNRTITTWIASVLTAKQRKDRIEAAQATPEKVPTR